MSAPIAEVFVRLAEYAGALGATPLNKHAGCWEHAIGTRWWVAINAHAENFGLAVTYTPGLDSTKDDRGEAVALAAERVIDAMLTATSRIATLALEGRR